MKTALGALLSAICVACLTFNALNFPDNTVRSSDGVSYLVAQWQVRSARKLLQADKINPRPLRSENHSHESRVGADQSESARGEALQRKTGQFGEEKQRGRAFPTREGSRKRSVRVSPGHNRAARLQSKIHVNVTDLRLPTVYLVAAPKTGSTAFAELLYQHPKMCRPQTKQSGPLGKKETHFFSKSKLRSKGLQHLSSLFEHDPKCQGGRPQDFIFVDATPDYMYGSGRSMKQILPPEMHSKLKFIAVFREPVARDVSWFNHARFNKEPGQYKFHNYDEWAETQLDIFKKRQQGLKQQEITGKDKRRSGLKGSLFWGLYDTNLDRWWKTWGSEQTLVLNYDTIVANTTDTMQRVAAFLGVDGSVWRNAQLPTANEREYKHKVRLQEARLDTCLSMQRFFEPHNQKLYRMLRTRNGIPPQQPPFPPFADPCRDLHPTPDVAKA